MRALQMRELSALDRADRVFRLICALVAAAAANWGWVVLPDGLDMLSPRGRVMVPGVLQMVAIGFWPGWIAYAWAELPAKSAMGYTRLALQLGFILVVSALAAAIVSGLVAETRH